MLKYNKLILLLLILALPGLEQILAQGVNYTGTSAANFLKIGLGAKNAGMAESDITFSGDASSLFWNPGSISRNPHASASFSYQQWLVQTNLSYFAFSMPTELATVALDVAYFGSGNIEETTLQMQDGTGRVVTANDMAIGLALARNLTDRFSVGLKVKYVREQLASATADAFAFDIGSVFETSFLNNMKLGITLSNFGSSMQFTGNDLLVTHVVPGSPTNKEIPSVLQTQTWNLPLYFKVGAATDVFNTEDYRMSASYTITDSRDYQPRHNIGGVFTFMNAVSLRGGYRINYDESSFSAGLGLNLNTSYAGNLMFDYAYSDFGRLNGIHQFSIAVNF